MGDARDLKAAQRHSDQAIAGRHELAAARKRVWERNHEAQRYKVTQSLHYFCVDSWWWARDADGTVHPTSTPGPSDGRILS